MKKIIFSRKGFDSSYGKGYSPILENKKMLSFPIPASQKDKEKGIDIRDLNFEGKPYFNYYKELYPKRAIYSAHFDPDLYRPTMTKRAKNWTGAFGQIGGAQTQLASSGIAEGDIFLFFGSFKHTFRNDKNVLRFEKQHEFHAIFGYLEIAAIVNPKDCEKWIHNTYKTHPHFANKEMELYKNNRVYLASSQLGKTNLPGYGIFKFNETLQLTKPGYNKSIWELPLCFSHEQGTKISYHGNKNRFRNIDDKLTLETVAIGQDFVVSENEKTYQWAVDLIRNAVTV